jgi:hypothetical protein
MEDAAGLGGVGLRKGGWGLNEEGDFRNHRFRCFLACLGTWGLVVVRCCEPVLKRFGVYQAYIVFQFTFANCER